MLYVSVAVVLCLTALSRGLQEEAIPELEIDVDELLDMPSDVERAARVKVRCVCTDVSSKARKPTLISRYFFSL